MCLCVRCVCAWVCEVCGFVCVCVWVGAELGGDVYALHINRVILIINVSGCKWLTQLLSVTLYSLYPSDSLLM